MGDNLTRIVEGTFVVIILAWVLTHAEQFGQVATSVGNVYTQGVQALSPSPSGYANPTFR